MRRLAIILLLTCCSSIGHAQYFSKTYPMYEQSNGYISSIQVVDDTIYTICSFLDTVYPYFPIGAFEKFDKTGNLLSKSVINIPYTTSIGANFNNLIRTNDGGFAYGGNTQDTSQTQNALVIIKYDRYGTFQWYNEIPGNNYPYFYCDAIMQDSFSNYYLTGSLTNSTTNDNDMYIAKADSSGNLIYLKTFANPNFYNSAFGICFNNKGHVVIAGDALSANVIDFDTIRDYMEIYELDTSGNQFNYVLGIDSNGPQAYYMIPSNDRGYFIASSYFCYRDQNQNKWQGAIAKLDSNFHEVWKIDAGPCSQNTQFNAQRLSPDGNYIAVGQWYDDTSAHMNGWIMKYSGSGQVIWSKLYRGVTSNGVNGDDNLFSSIAFLSDSSILCAGQALNNDGTIPPIQQGWLLHLDTAGCLPDNNSCGLSDGVADIPDDANFLVYPNPASSVFTVELAAPNDINGYSDLHFRLYDLTGRMVMDESIKEQTTVLHRGGLTDGMYLWQIADGDKGLKNGKLVFDPQSP